MYNYRIFISSLIIIFSSCSGQLDRLLPDTLDPKGEARLQNRYHDEEARAVLLAVEVPVRKGVQGLLAGPLRPVLEVQTPPAPAGAIVAEFAVAHDQHAPVSVPNCAAPPGPTDGIVGEDAVTHD